MGLITNYIETKRKINEYQLLEESLYNVNLMSDYFSKYDLLIDKYKEIELIKPDSAYNIAKNEDELIDLFTNQIKEIYSSKMCSILDEDSYEGSLGIMNGLLKNLNNSSSKYLKGQLNCFVLDVTRVIDKYSIIYNNYRNDKINKKSHIKQKKHNSGDDPLYSDIVEFCVQSGKVSASLLQRRFRLSYNRAARIVDLLEAREIIGPQNGSKPREVLIKLESKPVLVEYFSMSYGEEKIKDSLNKKDTMDYIDDGINGYEFEELTKELLIANSFTKVEVTKSSGDFGVDVIAIKDGVKYAIQCKKYSSLVGVKAVQEVIASKAMHECHVAVVLTNNFFTKAAIELAEKNNVLLWDRNKLIELLKKYNG